ncbi:MAG TPA: DoxX family membrane protein [Cyclobacteriaceae bacterium]|nr:DoxX family membrane protein [Cyclobacteriaceae bacterium]
MSKTTNYLYWGARLVAAIILLQTLYFKFTASPESVYIFSTIGMEPWGRIGVGAVELMAGVLLLLSATAWIGAGLALGLMVGAIGMHLTLLGIEVQGDGGQLFIYALVITFCSIFVLMVNKEKIQALIKRAAN